MFPTQFSLPKLLLVVIALIASAGANAGLFSFGGDNWKEEVLLHDGNKLVVDRSVTRGGSHEIGQQGSYTKQTLTFKHPVSGKMITWEDNATPDLRTSNFLPMALDVYQGAVYLVVSPMGCLSYNKWGRPNPSYVVFRHQGKGWERVDLQELPLETKALNLIASSPDTEVERLGRRMVDAETIKRINAEFRQPEYKSILREAVDTPAESCGKMISDGQGGWIGIGWFKDQPSLDACLTFCARKRVNGEHCPCNSIFQNKQP